MDIVIILLVGFIAGIVTGLIGASGVMIVVPALVALGYDTPDAIGASLFINIIAALVAALAYYKNKNINLKQGLWITIGSVIGAQLGSYLTKFIPEIGLGKAFSVFLLLSAFMFIYRGIKDIKYDKKFIDKNKEEYKNNYLLKIFRSNVIVSGLILGFIIGIICGVLGAGGGVMILLILVFVMQYPLHIGIGTSNLIMAFTAGSGAIGHAFTSNLPMKPSIIGSIGTVFGCVLAAKFANKINEKVLSIIVGIIFTILSIVMLIIL
ncbi:MAG TPA: sulfite exporter TauE/SafE family protein [Bacteroidales bacterium]|nr:sulfite exporter TauE/SafE family protein [Bacteroidales bacterium]